jgi:predicted DNA-binding protein (UPF0251 family)
MARPFKSRRICCSPDANYFKPAGVPMGALEEISLSMDEFEALRLADLEGLYHESAAQEMNVSRQTFGNIIASARKKMADCIVNTRAIKIEGGIFTMENKRTFVCAQCQHEWQVPFGTRRPHKCPECESRDIHRSLKERGSFHMAGGRGRCRRRSS